MALHLTEKNSSIIVLQGDTQQDFVNALQKASAVNGIIRSTQKEIKLTSTVDIPSNVRLELQNVTFKTDVLLVQLFNVIGNNISISTNFDISRSLIDTSTKGRCIELQNIDNVIIKDCTFSNFYHSVCAFNKTITNLRVINNKFVDTVRGDILLEDGIFNRIVINDNRFLGLKNVSTPISNNGEIKLICGFSYAQNITDTTLTTRRANRIEIKNNFVECSDHRPIFVANAKNVVVRDNYIEGTVGDKTQLGVSDDCIILDLCSDFEISGNKINASGENGIDLLSCQNGVVANNQTKKIDNFALALDISDQFMDGRASTVSQSFLLVENVRVYGNDFQAREGCIGITVAKNITFTNNRLEVNKYITGSYQHIVVVSSTTQSTWIQADTVRKIQGIRFFGTQSSEQNKTLILARNNVVDYGIQFDEMFPIQSNLITCVPLDRKAFVHSKIKFRNYKVFAVVSGDMIEVRNRLWDNARLKTCGIDVYLNDKDQVQFQVGDFFVDDFFGANSALTTIDGVIVYCY